MREIRRKLGVVGKMGGLKEEGEVLVIDPSGNTLGEFPADKRVIMSRSSRVGP